MKDFQGLDHFLKELKGFLTLQRIGLTLDKDIQYGKKISFISNDIIKKATIYYSKKNGISLVFDSKIEDDLSIRIKKIISSLTISENHHNWNRWIGSDESGKGDFFGPLVVASFYVDSGNKTVLHEMGVVDSKKLTDDNIVKLAEEIIARFPSCLEYSILTNSLYNKTYEKLVSQKKNLNDLLAWMHARVINKLSNKQRVDGIIIDKFENKSLVKEYLDAKFEKLPIVSVVRAEVDIAVATASIIARYFFIKSIDKISNEIGIDIPKGAGIKVDSIAQEIYLRNPESLNEIVKIHFKNFKKLHK